MRNVPSSEVETNLAQILDEVENGATVVITRDGKAVARLVPDADEKQVRKQAAIAEIREFRKSMPALTLDEIQSAKHEGHRY